MNESIVNAKRLIAGFVGLLVGAKVPICWGDSAAMSNDGVLHLPQPKTGEAAEVALLTRLAVHEGGHKVYTVPGFQQRLTEEESGFFNALEDPRMEALQIAAYPGASLVLARGLADALDRLKTRIANGDIQGNRAIQLSLLLQGSLAVAPTAPVAAAGPDLVNALAVFISERQQKAIEGAVSELKDLQSSLEAEQVAKALVLALREPEPPQPEEAAQGNQKQNQEDQPESGSDDENSADFQGQSEPEAGDEESTGEYSDQEASSGDASDAPPSGGDDQPSPDDAGSAQDPQNNGSDAGPSEGGEQTPAGSPGTDEATSGEPGGGGAPSDIEQQGDGDQEAQSGPAGDFTGPTSSMDFGDLLREAHAEKFGPPDDSSGQMSDVQLGETPDAQEIERLRQLFAQDHDVSSIEELVAIAMAALEGTQAPATDDDTGAVFASGPGYGLGSGSMSISGPDVRLQGVQAKLVNVLQRELQDKRKRPNRFAQAGGRVAPERHWRLKALGDTRIFRASRPAAGIEAAVTILVDKSESMDHQLATATEVALAFSLALQRIGRVKTRTATFPGAVEITETLQDFGESPRACERRCAHLVASGGTPIGAAVALESGRLSDTGISKKVLVVITDDDPGDPRVLELALQKADEVGITVVGVSIGCDIRRYLAKSVSIGVVGDLPDALSRLFREDLASVLAV